jgi:hypothetical protein
MRFYRTIIFISFLIFSGVSSISARETDTRTWIDLFATKKIKAATVGFVGEIYTMTNNSTLERTSIGLRGDYSLFPWLSAGTGYILVNFNHRDYHELANRFYFQAEPAWQVARFRFSFRERLQITNYPNSRTGEMNTRYWRNRFETVYKYGSKKLEPLINLESLYLLNDTGLNPFTEFRFTMGSNYHLTDHQLLKIYGMFTSGTYLDRYILGVVYNFTL